MNQASITLLKLRKPILGIFVLFCFFQTSYAEKKLENLIGYILKSKLTNSSLKGLKALSISRWHIDEMLIKHPLFGNFESSDVLLEFKLPALLFGKLHFSHLMIQHLTISQETESPFSPQIFNAIYKNNSIGIDKLIVSEMNVPYVPIPICVNFYKRPYLNFCEIYDLDRKNRAYFEIPRNGSFLKLKTDLSITSPNLIEMKLKGEGYIDKNSHLDLCGSLNYSTLASSIPLDLHIDYDTTLNLNGFISAETCHGFFQLKSDKCHASLNFSDLETLIPDSKLKGNIKLDLSGDLKDYEAHLASDKFYYNSKAFGPLDLTLLKKDQNPFELSGALHKGSSDEIKTSARYLQNEKFSQLELVMKSPKLDLIAATQIEAQKCKMLSCSIKSQNSPLLNGLLDDLTLEGQFHVVFNSSSFFSNIEFFGGFNDFKLGSYKLDHGQIAFKQNTDSGELKLDLDHFHTPLYEPISLNIDGKKDQMWELTAKAKSSFFDFITTADLKIDDNNLKLSIYDIIGSWQNEVIGMQGPIVCSKLDNEFQIDPFSLVLGPSRIEASCQKSTNKIQLKAQLENFSLSGIKVPHFDTPIVGQVSAFIDIDSDRPFQNMIQFSAKNLGLKQKGIYFPPLYIQGSQKFQKDELIYELSSYFANNDYLIMQGKIPFDLANFNIFKNRESFHSIFGKIALRDLGKYINMGSNTLGGDLFLDLNLKNSGHQFFTSGLVEGKNFHAGFPLLGIFLENGHMVFRPQGQSAEFTMKFSDFQNGQASCVGICNLGDFSYTAKTKFQDLFLKFKDVFSTNVSGELDASGSFRNIQSFGKLSLSHPQYQLIHRNIKKSKNYIIERPSIDLPKEVKNSFSFELNFDLNTQDHIKIKGAGLDSDWTGLANCHISQDSFSLNGNLKLAKGEYRFQTKKFVIDEGAIHLSQNSPSTITAKGHLDIPTHQIKVGLFGPLSEPKIQFSSLPALSEGAIFSYILFNKPINQLHPFQSIELAQTLLELSSDQNPFSLSKIRANLSIDQLDIRTSDEDSASLTLHLGKYIRPGLLIGLSQSKKASDMLIQLELKHGFLIKAESQEQKEGKFSLKWNKSF